jgi:hypothetical protein
MRFNGFKHTQASLKTKPQPQQPKLQLTPETLLQNNATVENPADFMRRLRNSPTFGLRENDRSVLFYKLAKYWEVI